MTEVEEYLQLIDDQKSNGRSIFLQCQNPKRKYKIDIGPKTKELKLFRICGISDKGDSNQHLSQILQILENTPSAHRYVRSSIKKERNNLYVDARGLQAILEYSNSDIVTESAAALYVVDNSQDIKEGILEIAKNEGS